MHQLSSWPMASGCSGFRSGAGTEEDKAQVVLLAPLRTAGLRHRREPCRKHLPHRQAHHCPDSQSPAAPRAAATARWVVGAGEWRTTTAQASSHQKKSR